MMTNEVVCIEFGYCVLGALLAENRCKFPSLQISPVDPDGADRRVHKPRLQSDVAEYRSSDNTRQHNWPTSMQYRHWSSVRPYGETNLRLDSREKT